MLTEEAFILLFFLCNLGCDKKGDAVHRRAFIVMVVLTAIICIFLLIYKQTCITQVLYEQQQLEQERAAITAEKEQQLQILFRLKNPRVVQEYATHKLGMKKILLRQVHTPDTQCLATELILRGAR